MKKNLIVLSILLLPASICVSSDEPPEDKIIRLEKIIEDQKHTINRAAKMVASLKEQLAEQQEENRRLRVLCRKAGIDINKPDNPNPQSDPNQPTDTISRIRTPLQVGQIVYFFVDDKFRIQQIIDDRNMIVELRIAQAENPDYGQLVWLRGFDTLNYVDDMIVAPPTKQLFKVSSTQQYVTAIGGSKTIFVLEPYVSQKQE